MRQGSCAVSSTSHTLAGTERPGVCSGTFAATPSRGKLPRGPYSLFSLPTITDADDPLAVAQDVWQPDLRSCNRSNIWSSRSLGSVQRLHSTYDGSGRQLQVGLVSASGSVGRCQVTDHMLGKGRGI